MENKKISTFLWGILTAAGISTALNIIAHGTWWDRYGFASVSCISEQTAVEMERTARMRAAGEREYDSEDIRMQIVYQLAKRSIVKVCAKDAAGSGIIWKIDDGIVVVSNRHLLMKDVEAEIVFGNGESAAADVIGYSQQYDIGFVRIQEEAVTDHMLREIYEAVPALYETASEEARAAFCSDNLGRRVLQVGAALDGQAASLSTGIIKGLAFVPLFITNVLVTACFSRAGMSGGGVFDEGGHLVGMISGGEVPEESQLREAEVTYSIPPSLILAEYEMIMNRED